MNSDEMSGKIKQGIGKVTGDDTLQAKGRAQEAKGNMKDSVRDAGRKVADSVDDAMHKDDRR